MSTTRDPRILFYTANDSTILIDRGDGTGIAYPYAQKSLYFHWDSTVPGVDEFGVPIPGGTSIHLTPFDSLPLVPLRWWGDYTCYVNDIAQTLSTFQDFVNFITTYLYKCCGGSTGGATAAKQDTQITAATSTNTKLDTLNTGVAGTNTRIDTTNTGIAGIKTGTDAMATAVSFGSIKVGNVTVQVKQTLVVSTSAYSANMVVGGKNAFNLLRTVNGSGKLQSVALIDNSNVKAAMTLLFFSQNPIGVYLDHASFTWSAADTDTLIRKVNIATADYETINGKAVADISSIAKDIYGTNGDTNIYVVMITTGTPTYATTNALTLKIGVIQD